MKRLLLPFLLLILSCTTTSTSMGIEPKYSPPSVSLIDYRQIREDEYSDLTDEETRFVMGELDGLCRKSWCSVGFNFQFGDKGSDIFCHFNEGYCVLIAKVYVGVVRSEYYSCKMRGFWNISRIISGKGQSRSLNNLFIIKVDKCVNLLDRVMP